MGWYKGEVFREKRRCWGVKKDIKQEKVHVRGWQCHVFIKKYAKKEHGIDN